MDIGKKFVKLQEEVLKVYMDLFDNTTVHMTSKVQKKLDDACDKYDMPHFTFNKVENGTVIGCGSMGPIITHGQDLKTEYQICLIEVFEEEK